MVSQELISQFGLPTKQIEKQYQVTLVDGSTMTLTEVSSRVLFWEIMQGDSHV